MDFEKVKTGADVPNDVNVIIEIPRDSEAVKYEVDKDSGAIFVDRQLSTPMRYPCNYGYVPHTLCGDGDPVDACVVIPVQLIPGCVIRCRPVGVLNMHDEAGEDQKLLMVPVNKVSSFYKHVNEAADLSQMILDQISHFFEHYKDLEEGKWVKVDGWGDSAQARSVILDSVRRFAEAPDKPNF